MLGLGLELNIDGEERVQDGFRGFESPVVDLLAGGYVEGVREAHAVWQTATYSHCAPLSVFIARSISYSETTDPR